MINQTYFTILSLVLLSVQVKAVQFGFTVCGSGNSKSKSDDTFDITYQWGQAVYKCTVTLTNAYNEIARCDTIDITPENCAPEYGLQISYGGDATPAAGTNRIDDVCVRSIMVNGVEIEATEARIGDDAGDISNKFAPYRYYDLGDDPDNLPTLVDGVVTVDADPTCGDLPALTWTGEGKFDHFIFTTTQWYNCDDGEVIAGFWKTGNCQTLSCLEDMMCVRPDISTTVGWNVLDDGTDDCYVYNIRGEFDTTFTATCNDGYFINGIYSTGTNGGCNTVHCWEELRCCKYDTDVIIVDDADSSHDWSTCFDKANEGWCQVEDNEFVTGLRRSDNDAAGEGVNELEEAKVRQIYLTATGGNQCQAVDVATFDWDVLTEQGLDAAGVEFNQLSDVLEFDVDETDLSLNIKVKLPYIGHASADDQGEEWGVTYVLDFEDYDAHQDAINEPGTCENRQESSYLNDAGESKDFVNEFWHYSYNPVSDIGSPGYLAYPPATPVTGLWTVAMDDDAQCGKVIYTGKFTWSDLRGCKSYGGNGDSYTSIATLPDGSPDPDWLNITGTLYVNLVSPFWYDADYKFYRVYQLLSQPFVIAISKVVNVLGSTGINVMTMSVIAVYKQDEGPDSNKDIDADFRLILLTECSDYMTLEVDAVMGVTFDGSGLTTPNTQVSNSDFEVAEDPENTGCLQNKGFICSQLWQIEATNIECTDEKGRDFSGNYALTFTPSCRDDINDDALSDHCDAFLVAHPQLSDHTGDRIALSTDLVWKDEICDPQIFVVQFEAEMVFYDKDDFVDPVDGSKLFQVGEDTIYVQVNTAFPSDTMTVFDTQLIEVYICTFDPINAPQSGSTGPTNADLANFGCFISDVAIRDVDYDEYFYHIYQANAADTSTPTIKSEKFDFKDSYTDYTEQEENVVRFSFTVPNEVARDTLYVMAEIEITLQEDLNLPRRRMLLSSSSEASTANQLQHFVQQVGINHGQEIINNKEPRYEPNNNYNPPEQYYPPQQPISAPYQPIPSNPSSYTINLSSPWIITLGGLLGLILTFNIIFMTYRNCCDPNGSSSGRASFMRRGKKGKYSVVNVESEFDSEAQMIQNDDDESQ